MSKTKELIAKQKAYALLAYLCEAYPRCFKHSDESPIPLKIGIFDEVTTAVGDRFGLDTVKVALALYVRRREYREALSKPGAVRVNLKGHSAGKVDAAHKQEAKEQSTNPGLNHRPKPQYQDKQVVAATDGKR